MFKLDFGGAFSLKCNDHAPTDQKGNRVAVLMEDVVKSASSALMRCLANEFQHLGQMYANQHAIVASKMTKVEKQRNKMTKASDWVR